MSNNCMELSCFFWNTECNELIFFKMSFLPVHLHKLILEFCLIKLQSGLPLYDPTQQNMRTDKQTQKKKFSFIPISGWEYPRMRESGEKVFIGINKRKQNLQQREASERELAEQALNKNHNFRFGDFSLCGTLLL